MSQLLPRDHVHKIFKNPWFTMFQTSGSVIANQILVNLLFILVGTDSETSNK